MKYVFILLSCSNVVKKLNNTVLHKILHDKMKEITNNIRLLK